MYVCVCVCRFTLTTRSCCQARAHLLLCPVITTVTRSCYQASACLCLCHVTITLTTRRDPLPCHHNCVSFKWTSFLTGHHFHLPSFSSVITTVSALIGPLFCMYLSLATRMKFGEAYNYIYSSHPVSPSVAQMLKSSVLL